MIMDGFYGHVVIVCVLIYLGGATAASQCALANRTEALSRCLLQQNPDSDATCSQAAMAAAIDECLVDIKAAFMDTSTFWFGSDYANNCPQGPVAGNVECENRNPEKQDSIGTRIFPGSNHYDSIDRYLKVVYTSNPGEYTGCGNTYTFPDEWTQEIDPLTPSPVRPWQTRRLPALQWTYTAGELYTLLIFDVGYGNMHGVYINIQANHMVTAETAQPYYGPLTPTSLHNPYAFLLMKQSGHLDLTTEWANKIANPDTEYTIPELMAGLSLTGPLAVNWVVATGDAYSMELMLSRQLVNMCPNLVAEAMDNMTRPFLPRPASLDVSLNVTFSPEPMSYTACCKGHSYPAKLFTLNPLGNHIYKTAEVRSNASLSVSFLKKGYYNQASNFTGDLYTLMTVDPDVPFSHAGTESRPLLHYLVVNIPDGDVSQGDVIETYRGPAPPDATHYYYFLLYKQSSMLTNATAASFTGTQCVESLVGRCLYDINRAVDEQNLTLAGASWMRATRDDYVIYRNILRGQAVKEECPGQPGYEDPCPTQGASRLTVSMVAVFAMTIIVLIK